MGSVESERRRQLAHPVLSIAETLVDQASDCFGAGGFRVGLSVDPGCDPCGQVGGDADTGQRGYARRRAAAWSFLIISY
jgi:hypothetical protein